nr:MAG TPA: hypothetical protein [Caudoviricetes sp.]
MRNQMKRACAGNTDPQSNTLLTISSKMYYFFYY